MRLNESIVFSLKHLQTVDPHSEIRLILDCFESLQVHFFRYGGIARSDYITMCQKPSDKHGHSLDYLIA